MIHAEKFAQNDLIFFLKSNGNLTDDILTSHFGDFSSKPSDFVFSFEEKELIHKCVKHVQYIVDFDGMNENLAHFGIADNIELPISSQPENVVSVPKTNTHIVLDKLLRIANQNAIRKREGCRFDNDVKEFATYLRMVCGPFAYETLQKNLELCLPSISATNRYMRKKVTIWLKESYELKS